MRIRIAGGVAALLIALPLFGQADLRVHRIGPDRARAGLTPNVVVNFSNAGPAVADDVVVHVTSPLLSAPLSTTLPRLVRNSGSTLEVPLPPQPAGSITITAEAQSSTPDPNPDNNRVTKVIEVLALPDLTVRMDPLPVVQPSVPFTVTVSLLNDSLYAAHDVVVTVALPDGMTAAGLPPSCHEEPGRVICNIAQIASTVWKPPAAGSDPLAATRISLALILAQSARGAVTLRATAVAREADFDETTNSASQTAKVSRTFRVTSTADSGVGSLRQAILDANAQCLTTNDRCAIAFAIDEPSVNRWKTIHIDSALPAISGPREIVIDGATQSAAYGDTNPDGPEIELAGSIAAADGLAVETRCHSTVANLAINGFGANGLVMREYRWSCLSDGFLPPTWETRETTLSGLFVGTDPTGSTAIPNGARGITTVLRTTEATIRDCVVSGNTRSGIFLDGSSPMIIENNRLGLQAHADAPLPNGASGIYIGAPVTSFVMKNYVDVRNNAIAFNRDFGIAVHPRDDWNPFQPYVRASRNRIWANAVNAIDIGLDGVATTVAAVGGFLPAPVITSARFDATTNTTTIEGYLGFERNDRNGGGLPFAVEVELFVSRTPGARHAGDAEQFLTSTSLPRPSAGGPVTLPSTFRVSYPGNLTGRWITATITRSTFDHEKDDTGQTRIATTELSAPVAVTTD